MGYPPLPLPLRLQNKNPPRISAVVNERSSHSLQNQPNRSFSFDLSFFSVVVVVLFLDLTVYFCFVLLTSSPSLPVQRNDLLPLLLAELMTILIFMPVT